MFRLSRRADYAVRTLLELAAAEGDRLTAQLVAKRGSIPLPFLRKVVADLVAAELVETQPGPTGGLSLTRPAAGISVLDAIEAIEGSVCLNACLLRPDECPRDRICPAHTFWGRLQAMVVAELRAANFALLAEEYRQLRGHPRSREQIINLNSLSLPSSRISPAARDESLIFIKE